MGYRLSSFDAQSLGTQAVLSDNAGEVYAPVVQVPGGWHDVYGATQRSLMSSIVSHEATWDNTGSGMQAAIIALRGKIGKRAELKRTWADGAVERIEARLLRFDEMVQTTESAKFWTRARLSFQLLEPAWRGTLVGQEMDSPDGPSLLNNGHYLDANTIRTTSGAIGTNNLSLTNSGNATITTSGSLSVQAGGGGTITAIVGKIVISGSTVVHWRSNLGAYGGLSGSGMWVIHFGIKRVTLNGTSVYRNFSLRPGHKIADWIYIPPGGCTLQVTLSGTGSNHIVGFGTYRHASY